MNGDMKGWTRQTLEIIWVTTYGGRIDMEGNWITETGRFVKWELRDAKPGEPWQFSLTLAMALAGPLQEKPEVLAERLAAALTAQAPSGWVFGALGTYVNAYFEPRALKDYVKQDRRLKLADMQVLDGSGYVLYRLAVLKKALKARGVMPTGLLEPLEKEVLKRFHSLFLLPQDEAECQRWFKEVSQLTVSGRLLDLSEAEKGALLGFLNEI